ncbi:MAG TPA: diguanylate cyclase [Actinomycetes bacterium]|nr:diguanylate cyclase [Actinomycetes bacterium]
MRILVVDDEPLSRLVVQAALDRLGHQWTAAEDGQAAWQCFSQDKPDVLITDLLMPGLDGLELCRRVRADTRAGYTYIVLVTVLGDRQDIVRGMDAGADDYLVKPLQLFDLRARLIAAQRVTDLHAELDSHRAQLAHLARHDPLTGLGNRRSLQQDLEVLHARSQRYRRRFALAMCDIDRFKAYNDTHGHQAGDQALRAVAATIARELRGGDAVYRYGGEEFLLVLPEQTLDTALIAVERVRSAMERLAIPQTAAGPSGMLTLSAGIAAFGPGEPTTAEELLKQADVALYRAKSAGRNQLALAHSPAN